jgi:ribosome-binding ATPase YchF (GTP1/OBG family)
MIPLDIKSGRIRKHQRDARIKAVQLVKEMIEYRNAEITTLSRNLKQEVARLHRERSPKQHIEQYKELKEIIDQISRHISDNDYDANHLLIFLTQTPEKAVYPVDAGKTEVPDAIHYIQ